MCNLYPWNEGLGGDGWQEAHPAESPVGESWVRYAGSFSTSSLLGQPPRADEGHSKCWYDGYAPNNPLGTLTAKIKSSAKQALCCPSFSSFQPCNLQVKQARCLHNDETLQSSFSQFSIHAKKACSDFYKQHQVRYWGIQLSCPLSFHNPFCPFCLGPQEHWAWKPDSSAFAILLGLSAEDSQAW